MHEGEALIDVRPAIETMLGITSQEWLGTYLGWQEVIHPDDRQRYVDIYLSSFARREGFEATFRLRRHDGTYRWVIDRGVPYLDDSGNCLGYPASGREITERVEAEAAHHEHRQRGEEGAGWQSRWRGCSCRRRPT